MYYQSLSNRFKNYVSETSLKGPSEDIDLNVVLSNDRTNECMKIYYTFKFGCENHSVTSQPDGETAHQL